MALRVGTTVQAIQQAIAATLRDAFAALKPDVINDIDWIVPKATGQLREDVKMRFDSSAATDTAIRLVFGAHAVSKQGFNYAPVVNNMPQSSLVHYGEYRYVDYYHHRPKKWGGPPAFLNDPGAQHNWMQFLILHAKKWLKEYLAQYLKQHAAALGLKFGNAQNVVPVKEVG